MFSLLQCCHMVNMVLPKLKPTLHKVGLFWSPIDILMSCGAPNLLKMDTSFPEKALRRCKVQRY